MFKKICKIMVVCMVAVMTMVNVASATLVLDSEPSEKTILCKSPAGYNMTVKDYYNYMKRFDGVKCTTYFTENGNITENCYVTSCTVDESGTLRISVNKYVNDSYEDLMLVSKEWFGITIYSDYNFKITNSGTLYNVAIAWHEYHEFCSDDATKFEFVHDYSSYINGFDNSTGYLNGEFLPPMAMLDDDASRVCSWFGYELSFLMNGFLWDALDNYGEYDVCVPVINTIMGGTVTGVTLNQDYMIVYKSNSDMVKWFTYTYPRCWNECESKYNMVNVY